jgi:hypothetical protein
VRAWGPTDRAGSNDEGSQVEGTLAVGRDPVCVCEDCTLDRIDEDVCRDRGHAQALAAVLGAARVLVGPVVAI